MKGFTMDEERLNGNGGGAYSGYEALANIYEQKDAIKVQLVSYHRH